MENEIISILNENIKVKEAIKDLKTIIAEISKEIINAYRNKKNSNSNISFLYKKEILLLELVPLEIHQM